MINSINRHGEITTNKNEALVTFPFYRLNTDSPEVLEENYRNKIKEMNYTDGFFYADSITSIRDRVQLSFDLTGAFDFHNIRKLNFEDMFPYFQSMIEIAKTNVDVLWEKSNFALDTQEEKVKAFLFDFEGFQLYKKDTPLDGLKELILLSLTNKESILGKPRRVDFIQQTEQVIEFSEEILRCNSIEDVETLCLGYIKDIEYEKERKRQEEEEKKRNSSFYKMKQKVKPGKNNTKEEDASTDEHLKQSLQAKEENQGGDSKSKSKQGLIDRMTTPKGMLVSIIAVIVIGVLGTAAGSLASNDEQANAQEKVDKQEEILQVYRLYANANSDEGRKKAYAKMDALGYNNLPDKDQEVLVNWYIKQNKMVKALSLDEDTAYQIGNIMVERDDGFDRLKEVSSKISDNEVINFDIASMENEYQTMIENKNISLNERRGRELVEAYLQTNQLDELETYMDEINEKDPSSHENLQKYHDKKAMVYEDKRKIQDKIDDLKTKIENKKNDKSDADKDDKKEKIQDKIDGLNNKLGDKKEELKDKEEKLAD